MEATKLDVSMLWVVAHVIVNLCYVTSRSESCSYLYCTYVSTDRIPRCAFACNVARLAVDFLLNQLT